jgi:hypothetical protein
MVAPSALNEPRVVKQVDHLAIRVADPGPLFSLLANTFRLPVAWPIASYGIVRSGGVWAGNVNLETVRFGPAPKRSAPGVPSAGFYGLAFEPGALLDSLGELARRDIPHGPPVPYEGRRLDGTTGTLYTTVVLGGLLGHSRLATSSLRERFGGRSQVNLVAGKWIGKLINSPLGARVALKLLPPAMVYLVEYTHDVDQLRSVLRAELAAREGGSLGIQKVQEILVGVADLAKARRHWARLYAPVRPAGDGVWQLGQDPVVRLVPSPANIIQGIVLKVASLDRARHFLRAQNMLGDASSQHVTVDPAKIYGLAIQVVE